MKVACKGTPVRDQEGTTTEGEGIGQGCEKHASILPEDIINITVRTLIGKSIKLRSATSLTVADVKESLSQVLGMRWDNMRLLFKGRQLEDTETLAAAGIKDGLFIYISTGLREDSD